jgi:flagellar hook capping protein FlgD
MARMGGGELDAIFGGNDLRGLFAGLSPARQTVTVTVSGARGSAVTPLGTLAVEVMGAPAPMHPIVTPNPMRTQSVISFATTLRAPLRVDLFDATGRRVRRLAEDAAATAGWHAITVDGRDDRGAALPAGMYFYRVVADNRAVNGRLVLIK